MLRVNVTCSYNIVVEEHELEAGCESAGCGQCDGCLRQAREGSQDHEHDPESSSVGSFDSDEDEHEYDEDEYDDSFSTSSAEVGDNSMAIVPYGQETSRRRRRLRAPDEAATRSRNDDPDDDDPGSSAAPAEDEGRESNNRRRRRHNRSGRNQCIQGEVVLGQPTVMYRTQPQQLSGPAAAAASAAAAAVAAASGPSQRIVVQAAARAAAAAAANSAAQENEENGSRRISGGTRPSSLQSASDAAQAQDTADEDLNELREANRWHSMSSRDSSAHSDQDSLFSRETLRRAEAEIRAELEAQTESNLDAHLMYGSMRSSAAPFESRGHHAPHLSHTYPGPGRTQETTSQSYDPQQASATYMDFWDTPAGSLGGAQQPLARPDDSAGSMGSADQYAESDLAALQKEASLLEQLRFHESLRQQMTLPEDIAQAGSGAAAVAVAAGGPKCLFGRQAHERVPRAPSARRTPLYGRRAQIVSPASGRRDSPVAVSLDSAVAIHGTANGDMPTLVRGANQTPIDTPHLMEMRGGAQVLIVDPADPLQAEASQEGTTAAPKDHRGAGASTGTAAAHQEPDWGVYRPTPATGASPQVAMSSGSRQRISDAPNDTRPGRRQQVNIASDPKMAGAGLRLHAHTHARAERDEQARKGPEGRRSHSNLLASSLRLEPRAGQPPAHGRRAAVDGPSSWLHTARAQQAPSQQQQQPASQQQLGAGAGSSLRGHLQQQQPGRIAAGRRRGALQHSRFTGLNINGHSTRLLGHMPSMTRADTITAQQQH